MRRERHDGIDDRWRFAKGFCISADSFLPRLAVHGQGSLRSDESVGLFPREVRCAPFRRFYFYFFARLDLDQRLGCGPVLLVGLQPNCPAHHFGVIVDGHGRARPAACHLPLSDLVRIVQLVLSRSKRNLQPAVAGFVAVEQCPVRTGHIRALRLRDRITHVVGRRVQRAQRLHRAFQLRLQCREQRRALRLRIRRRRLHRGQGQGGKQNKPTEDRN